jgi:hypothetical protein
MKYNTPSLKRKPLLASGGRDMLMKIGSEVFAFRREV